MGWVQKNEYSDEQNLSSMSDNIDINRVTMDRSFITVNYGTTPATVTLLIGSIVEVNGNQYAIESADVVFQMSNAAHLYLGFDGTTMTSHATKGTFNAAKGGWYQSGTVRTLRWNIDQVTDITALDVDLEMTFDNNGLFHYTKALSVPIGAWNMQSTPGFSVDVTGITLIKIAGMQVGIVNDAQTSVLNIDHSGGASLDPAGSVIATDLGGGVTRITISRTGTGDFAAAAYSSLANNRGYIIINFAE